MLVFTPRQNSLDCAGAKFADNERLLERHKTVSVNALQKMLMGFRGITKKGFQTFLVTFCINMRFLLMRDGVSIEISSVGRRVASFSMNK